MKIAVCLRQGQDGEINPFDASAYECALSFPDAEISLVSMGPASVAGLLERLSRLGATRAILLCDPAFAGADTLATAYTLSLAMKKLNPDLIFCGRQTLIGDTGQTGPMLAQMLGRSFYAGVLSLNGLICRTRNGEQTIRPPTVLTVEKEAILRLPSLRSHSVTPEIWGASALGAEVSRCGLQGSPTRVLKTFENRSGRRICKMISPEQFRAVLSEVLSAKAAPNEAHFSSSGEKLRRVFCIGDSTFPHAQAICEKPEILPLTDALTLVEIIQREEPDAILFGNDPAGKELAARTAATLQTGLCADCTALDVEDDRLVMYRPALSGTLIAKIVCRVKPAMATMQNLTDDTGKLTIAAGYGLREHLDEIRAFAKRLNADFAVSRKLVDFGYAPYAEQVGLTGKTVSPRVYLAIGISGAIHHIVGMNRSGIVIAVNPDRDAQIFDYADYGILCDFSVFKKEMESC